MRVRVALNSWALAALLVGTGASASAMTGAAAVAAPANPVTNSFNAAVSAFGTTPYYPSGFLLTPPFLPQSMIDYHMADMTGQLAHQVSLAALELARFHGVDARGIMTDAGYLRLQAERLGQEVFTGLLSLVSPVSAALSLAVPEQAPGVRSPRVFTPETLPARQPTGVVGVGDAASGGASVATRMEADGGRAGSARGLLRRMNGARAPGDVSETDQGRRPFDTPE